MAQTQQTNPHTDQNESNEKRGDVPPSKPEVAAVDGNKNTDSVSKKQENSDPDSFLTRWKKPEWVIVYITAAYTLVALGGLCVVFWQVWLMKDTSRRQLRAYVVVKRGIIANVTNPLPSPRERIDTVARILDPQAGPTAQITIKNTGQTPAYELVHWGRICIHEFPLTSTLPAMPPRDANFWTVMGPGIVEVKTVRFPRPLNERETEGLHNGTMAIYCHGQIEYRDAFKKLRVTHYRCMYHAMRGRIGVNTDLTYCEDGNEAT